MPERIIPILDSIAMTLFTVFFAVAFSSIVTITGGVLAILWWATKIKRDVEKYHNGNIWTFVKWIVKKN